MQQSSLLVLSVSHQTPISAITVKADLSAISDLQRTTTLISAPDRSERGVRPEICPTSGSGIRDLSICRGDAVVFQRSGKAMACAISSTVRNTDSGVVSSDLQGNDLRSPVPHRSDRKKGFVGAGFQKLSEGRGSGRCG